MIDVKEIKEGKYLTINASANNKAFFDNEGGRYCYVMRLFDTEPIEEWSYLDLHFETIQDAFEFYEKFIQHALDLYSGDFELVKTPIISAETIKDFDFHDDFILATDFMQAEVARFDKNGVPKERYNTKR